MMELEHGVLIGSFFLLQKQSSVKKTEAFSILF